MLGARGFDWERLSREPGFGRFSEAAVAALSRETAAPLLEALGRRPAASAVELAAFASAFQGVAPRIATLPDLEELPPELAEFHRFEARQSAARGGKLLEVYGHVSSALFHEGIEAVTLKGAALLLAGTADPGHRPMGDIDLLLADPGRMDEAARALALLGWTGLFDTRRHRVLARKGEQVVRPGCSDPENPIRIELHYALRIPVLGRAYDLTQELLASAEPFEREGIRGLLSTGNALRRHLLVHATEDFAALGIRGIQAHDFRLLSRPAGPLQIVLSDADRRAGLAPVACAAHVIEKLFPGSFAPEFLDALRRDVPKALLDRASEVPALRGTRPSEGGTARGLSLIESPVAKARFLLRSVFPPPEEVKVNVAPEASGPRLAAAWLRLFVRRAGRLLGRPRHREDADRGRVLRPGELRIHERFGPATVNRGAVLFECEWDGGVFESGVMLGGVFKSGTFCGGVFWSSHWKGGTWAGGFWHNGFGEDGRYRPRDWSPRTTAPLQPPPASPAPAADGRRRVTIHTASVYPDLVRVWRASIARAVPPDDADLQVFDDSEERNLSGERLEGVTLLMRSPACRDFHEAYNDALARATTPFLAFVDTDVFWVSRDPWRHVLRELEDPNVAAVSCVSRTATASHGTFAVVMRVAAYREALRAVPDGFFPFREDETAGGAPGRFRGHDTADLATRAVQAAGFTVKLLNLEKQGQFVRFDAITNTRLIGGWVGPRVLARMALLDSYFRRGILGCFALARLHDDLFPGGSRFGLPISRSAFWRSFLRHPRALARAVRDSWEFSAGARRIRRFLAGAHGAPTA